MTVRHLLLWVVLWLAVASLLAACVPAHDPLPSRRTQRVVVFGRVVPCAFGLPASFQIGLFTPDAPPGQPVTAGRQLRRLLPRTTRTVRLKVRREVQRVERTTWHWRHDRRVALFDHRRRRLTPYRFNRVWRIAAGLLCYDTVAADPNSAQRAALASGVPSYVAADISPRDTSAYGLLTPRGQRLGPADYIRLVCIGPNAVWALRVRRARLYHGVIDTLARESIPFDSTALILPDVAGLLRRRSPTPRTRYTLLGPQQLEADTSTVSYHHLDGRRAFAGRFAEAGPFREGRAVVKVGARYGIIDTTGHWLLPLVAELRALGLTSTELRRGGETDPLRLFEPTDPERRYDW